MPLGRHHERSRSRTILRLHGRNAIPAPRARQDDGQPTGNQDVWHYHVHVFPRYAGDQLYGSDPCHPPREERAEQAHLLREHLARSSA